MTGQTNLTFGGDVESNPGPTSVSCMWRGVLHWTVHPDGGPEPMDKPRQSDLFDEHVEEQIVGIAFESVGAPLYKHERWGRKQQQLWYDV